MSTPGVWQVLDLLARGLSTREVATRLSISTVGVRVHTKLMCPIFLPLTRLD